LEIEDIKKELNEAETRIKLINPALYRRGWTEDLIRQEETAGRVDIVNGIPQRREKGRVDYLLCIKTNPVSEPLPVALIEAKKNTEHPSKGLEQAKKYARLNNVPFVYATNGYLFVEYDRFTGITSPPQSMEEFPTPDELRTRYEEGMGISLESDSAKPLLAPYPWGTSTRRYYQDAAIRAALEAIARGRKRLLLYLATGSGKTFIAVHILKKIADAGQLRRALFVCDRDELRDQALAAFQNVFGADAAEVTSSNPQKNARILIATYQTLNVAGENEDAKFFLENYPEDYFSHIIIDECHRSAWGKWSIIFRRNPNAVQIGLTATPRSFEGGTPEERREDEEITANNIAYFGEPIYEYNMAQGIEDGYLAACEIIRRTIDIDARGVSREDIEERGAKDAITGQPVQLSETREFYEAYTFEEKIQLPDRVRAMCEDLFQMLLQTGGPYQKTVIFCVRDSHADAVAIEMNNLYAEWCRENGEKPVEPYAFKCTASVEGSRYISDLRGSERSHFIATTVDLITTGVDVPIVKNVVFFKYVRSPIAFQQMMGRGSRIHPQTNKLMFRVYDYTNATRLLGKDFVSRPYPSKEIRDYERKSKEKIIRVEGFEVRVNPAGTYIVAEVEGKLGMITLEEYKQRIAESLLKEARTIDDFRELWINPNTRKKLIDSLPADGRGLRMLKEILQREDYDFYDILIELAYGVAPKTRSERFQSFLYKHEKWLKRLPAGCANTLIALARQFEKGGTEELENPRIFQVPEVSKAGGFQTLKGIDDPHHLVEETKRRLFAA
jgi:type I restriction enzyme R subunit